MHRRMNRRVGLLGAAALIVVPFAVGCSANVGGTTKVGAPTPGGAAGEVVPQARVLPATLNLTDTAAAVEAQRFVRVKTTIDASFGTLASGSVTTTVTEDTKTHNVEATGSFSGMIGARDAGSSAGDYTVRLVGSNVYLRLGSMTKWVKVDAGFAGAGFDTKPLTAQGLIDGFAKAGVKLSKNGTVEQNGETLTRYVGTFDLDDLATSMNHDGAGLESFLKKDLQSADARATVTMLVDASGKPSQVNVDASIGGDHKGSFTLTADFLEVTDTPDIAAPPASQITDFKSGLKGLLDGGN